MIENTANIFGKEIIRRRGQTITRPPDGSSEGHVSVTWGNVVSTGKVVISTRCFSFSFSIEYLYTCRTEVIPFCRMYIEYELGVRRVSSAPVAVDGGVADGKDVKSETGKVVTHGHLWDRRWRCEVVCVTVEYMGLFSLLLLGVAPCLHQRRRVKLGLHPGIMLPKGQAPRTLG